MVVASERIFAQFDLEREDVVALLRLLKRGFVLDLT